MSAQDNPAPNDAPAPSGIEHSQGRRIPSSLAKEMLALVENLQVPEATLATYRKIAETGQMPPQAGPDKPQGWGEHGSMDGKNETAPHDESQDEELMAELAAEYRLSPESMRIVRKTFHLPPPPTDEQDKPQG